MAYFSHKLSGEESEKCVELSSLEKFYTAAVREAPAKEKCCSNGILERAWESKVPFPMFGTGMRVENSVPQNGREWEFPITPEWSQY